MPDVGTPVAAARPRGPGSRGPVRALLAHPVARFVLVGATTGVLHLGGFWLLRTWWEPVAANAVALVVATVVNTEGNRRLTFPGHEPVPVWRQHLKAGFALAASLGVSAVALTLVTTSHRVVELALVVAADGVAAAVRYLLLRHWVFRAARPAPSARSNPPGPEGASWSS